MSIGTRLSREILDMVVTSESAGEYSQPAPMETHRVPGFYPFVVAEVNVHQHHLRLVGYNQTNCLLRIWRSSGSRFAVWRSGAADGPIPPPRTCG
jgi:hypothetical protein